MHDEAKTIFQPYFMPGEKVIWAGRPKQGFHFTLFDIFLVPFSLAFFAFALAWEYVVLFVEDPEWLFAIFGLPFLLVGFQMLAWRFVTDKNRRARTHYALTDQRALVLETGKEPRLFAYVPSDLFDLRLVNRKPYGDVSFGKWKIPVGKRGSISHWPYGVFSGFRLIENAEEVYEKLEKLRDKK